ncbi:hypothetical protein PGH12_11100 [Chryseobacterium wangxinyae]|uniref:hypothetical protein n=1 Tax=Chryseobacterium sp. CY350 TaxID=2997336 RepID=UPI002270B6BC|nr:hypothetical protein [Chryseobacterium sp. CY350]MCY0976384.1 hypothetical protein [Chryseobacterium sp. CY350]WBZ94020.1 hypothetical protein PGH12_11100 [Chryseobacterium sp. CY350]
MDENKEFESGFSTEDVPISDGFWTYMENYWHHNREFPESTEVSLKKKADLIGGKVPASQLPSYVDDVLEFETVENLPRPGEKGKIYLITNDNSQFRWSGSEYIQLNSDEFLMTTNTVQNVTNRKFFYTQGANWADNSLITYANTPVNPSMTFYKEGANIGQLGFDGGGFHFVNGDWIGYFPVKAGGYIVDGSDNNHIVLAGGGTQVKSDFALSTQLNDYATLNTDQTLIGKKIFKVGYTNYDPDGLFSSDARPLSVSTPGNNSILLGYKDYGSGQYYSRIGFKNIPGQTNWSVGALGNDFVIGVDNDQLETFKIRPSGATSKIQNQTQVFEKVYQGAYPNGSPITGMLVLKIPQASPDQVMFSIDINIYGYESSYIGKINVSFYKYVSGLIIPNGAKCIFNVTENFPTNVARVGIGSDGFVSILLGQPDTFWNSYFSFEVARVQTHFINYTQDWSQGWTHAIETDINQYGPNIITLPTDVVATKGWVVNNLNTQLKNYVTQSALNSQLNAKVDAIRGDEGNNINNFDSLVNKTQIGSIYTPADGNRWWHLINIRHRNGEQDGAGWGSQIRIDMNGDSSDFQFRQMKGSAWLPWYTLYHSGNFNPANYLTIETPQTIVGDKTFSAITKAKFLNTVDAQKGITKTIGNGYGNLNRRTNPTEYSFWGNPTGAIVIILPSQFIYQNNFDIDIVDTQWANLHQKLQINTYGSLAYSKALLSNNTGAVDAVSRLRIGKLADNRSCLIINDVDKVWSYPQMVVNQYEGGSLLMATGDWTTQLMTDLSSITIQQEVTITKAVNSTHTHSFASLTSKPTTLAGYGITDSVSTSHAANSVSASLMNNWNTAYNWGNHATAGYAAQAWVSSNFPNQALSANDETNLGQTVTLTNGNSVQITNNFVGSRDGSRNPDDINPAENGHRARFDFAHASSVKGSGNYAGIMTYSPWDGTSASTGDSSYQLAFANQTGINGKGVPMLKLRKGIDDKWSSDWYKMWSDGDFSQDDINKWNDLVSNAATHAWASANFLSKSGGTVEGKIKINPGTGVTGNSPIAGNANPASLLLSGDNGLWGTAFGHNSNTGDLWLQPQRFDGGSQLYNINLAPLGGTVTVNNQPVATRSWVQSQNYAPYEFVESKINELKGEIVDPPAFAIRNEFTTVIITDKYSGNPLELIEELIPESYISIINLSKKAIELSRDGETIDRIFEFETSEYYITKDENRLVKKGTYKSAQLLI